MFNIINKLIILIAFFTISFFSNVLVNPVLADHCGDLNFCESCVSSHCGWGGPNGDIKCRDAGSNSYSCPANTYSIWYTLPGQCGTSSGNWCSGNVATAPPPCSTFNFNCSSCLQQPACGYNGSQCLPIDPNIGDACPAGQTAWYWYTCSQNQCTSAAPSPSPSPSPSPAPSVAPGTRGYLPNVQVCNNQGQWGNTTVGVCTTYCGTPPAAGQPAPPPVVITTPITIPPVAPQAPLTPASATTPWIQTSGGDVHSNTKIDVP